MGSEMCIRDSSEGGLLTAFAQGALRYGVGARLVIDEVCERDGLSPTQALLSETPGRVLCAVPRTEEQRFQDMLAARGVPAARVGVTGGDVLDVQGHFQVTCDDARAAFEAPLPSRFSS